MIWPEDRCIHVRGPIEEIELGCPACGHVWYADGHLDDRGWWVVEDPDDAICPVCGGPEGEA